jgi:hypothetical protein
MSVQNIGSYIEWILIYFMTPFQPPRWSSAWSYGDLWKTNRRDYWKMR